MHGYTIGAYQTSDVIDIPHTSDVTAVPKDVGRGRGVRMRVDIHVSPGFPEGGSLRKVGRYERTDPNESSLAGERGENDHRENREQGDKIPDKPMRVAVRTSMTPRGTHGEIERP